MNMIVFHLLLATKLLGIWLERPAGSILISFEDWMEEHSEFLLDFV